MGDDSNYGGSQNPGSDYSGSQSPASPYTGNPVQTNTVVFQVKAVVGEKISMASLLPNSLPVKKVNWNIGSGAIKYYFNTMTEGTVDLLIASDKNRLNLDFFWIEGGAKVVMAVIEYEVAGVHFTLNYQWDFYVDAPKLIRLEAKISKVNLRNKKRLWFLEFKEQLTKLKSNPGIEWDWEVEMPKTSDGFVKDLQTVKPGGRIKEQLIEGSKKTRKLIRGSDKGALDIVDDNPVEGKPGREPTYDIGLFSFPPKTVAGKSEAQTGIHDSPADTLEPLDQHFTVKEDFKYFLLFKPDKPGAIWVPIAKAEWFWQADAIKKDGVWKFKIPPSPTGGLSRKGEPTTEFPLYKGNGANHVWLDMP